MARKLDQIIVVDLEATCWSGEPPIGEESEIIEIGLCLLDLASEERLDNRALLVKPQRSKISPYCEELTTLTQSQVDAGISFEEACQVLIREYNSRNRTWASYGDYDRIQLQAQCQAWGVDYPFGRSHINVKNLLALQLKLKREVGLPAAMDLLGMSLEGTLHRGIDDAWNIAAVLGRVLYPHTG